MTYQTFCAIQFLRIKSKAEAHAPGPKKPSLVQTELKKGGKKNG